MEVETQRRQVIERLVYDIYLPEIKNEVASVIKQTGENVLLQKEWLDTFDRVIIAPTIPRLNIGAPSKKLVEAILTYLEMENEKDTN